MPYGMTDAAYAKEVARKQAAGITLTQPKDTAALARAAAAAKTVTSTPAVTAPKTVTTPTVAPKTVTATPTVTAPKTVTTPTAAPAAPGVPYGMTPATYAEEIKRKEATGATFTDQAAADAFKKANPGLFAPAVKPDTPVTPPVTPNPEIEALKRELARLQEEQVAPPGTSQDVLALLNQLMGGSQFPYEQMYRDVAATAPQWTPRPESELLTQARQYAGLQIDPQLQALQRALGQARQEAGTYTQEAEKRALESAIARGGGRSGVAEWLTAEQTKPITTALARAETAGLEQTQQLEARRGELEANQLAALRQLEHANASGNWQLAQQATAQLAQLAQQAQQFQQTYALNVLPYVQEPAGAAEDRWLREAETFGQAGGPSGAVGLREYATGKGASIGYDASTGQVIINGQRYTTQQLQAAGGYKEGDHWYLPQSWVDQQLGGR